MRIQWTRRLRVCFLLCILGGAPLMRDVRQYGPPNSSNTRRAPEDSEGDTCGAFHEVVCDANIRFFEKVGVWC
jgi:hypothetical protein